MSLFKAREWWYGCAGDNEEFDTGNMCVSNIDNNSDGKEKIIVGSLHGMLRIYCPTTKGGDPADMMLEFQTEAPILAVGAGCLVGADKQYLAILHPRKLCVCSVNVDTNTADTGTFYSLSQIYSHKLERTSCNMAIGKFGASKGKDFICVQSMDGMLTFYEQDSFAFARFLPSFLLPGPLCYIPYTDVFLTASSANCIEAYKYQTLAVSTESETKDQMKSGTGKRLRVDWTSNIGEAIQSIRCFDHAEGPPSIFALGEHALYCLKENGSIKYMKKFDFNPSCFVPYTSVLESTTNILVANHAATCFVFQDTMLVWSCKLSSPPVAMEVLTTGDTKGMIASLDEGGKISISYLGTDPALSSVPTPESREINYDEQDQEMAKLQQIIRESTTPMEHAPKLNDQPDFSLFVDPINGLDVVGIKHSDDDDTEYPTVTVKVNIRCSSKISLDKVSLTVMPQPPFYAVERTVTLTNVGGSNMDSMSGTLSQRCYTFGSGPTSIATFSIYNTGTKVAPDLSVPLVAHYMNTQDSPRSVHNTIHLPLSIAVTACLPAKSAAHKLTIETNKSAVNLLDLFSEISCESEGGQPSCIGLQFSGGEIVTILAAKNSQKYRIQSESFSALYIIIRQFINKTKRYFDKVGGPKFSITFPGPLPLQEYFDVIDTHFDLRMTQRKYREMLSQRAQQFRAIQRRLLSRFKDKTPSPLQNLDTLLDGTYQQILALADADLQTTTQLETVDEELGTATRLLLLLIQLWANMSDAEYTVLEAALTPTVCSSDDVGWEELSDASMTLLLRTCLAKTAKEQSVAAAQLKAPTDTSKLKKHIALLCERLGKGGKLIIAPENKASNRAKELKESLSRNEEKEIMSGGL